MKTEFQVGIDVSKHWFDYALLSPGREVMLTGQHANTLPGLRKMLREVGKATGGRADQILFCCEHTGLYSHFIEQLGSLAEGIQLWIAHPADIKRCMGVVRGKSDPVDAVRIAQYASRYSDKARLWKPQAASLVELRHLTALRLRMLKALHLLQVPVGELMEFDPGSARRMERGSKKSVEALQKEIAEVDEKIKQIVLGDPELRDNYELLRTVPGIGLRTAVALLVLTRNFTIMVDARQLACYAGVAPFEHESGKSVRGRKRVSKYANHALKTVLHMAAMAAVRSDDELKGYYRRKVAEGKNKMSVINAVRFKVIARAISVIKKRKPFIPKENMEVQTCF